MVAFTRIWFGQRSDNCRWRGLRRTLHPWWYGICLLLWIAGRTVLWLAAASIAGDGPGVLLRGLVLTVVMLAFGLAISASSPVCSLVGRYQQRKATPHPGVNLVDAHGWHRGWRHLLSRFLGSSCLSRSRSADCWCRAPDRYGLSIDLCFSAGGSGGRGASLSAAADPLDSSKAWEKSPWAMPGRRSSPQVGYFFAVLSLFTFAISSGGGARALWRGGLRHGCLCHTRLNAIWASAPVGIATTGGCSAVGVPAHGPAGGMLSAVFVVFMVVAGAISSEPLFRLHWGCLATQRG